MDALRKQGSEKHHRISPAARGGLLLLGWAVLGIFAHLAGNLGLPERTIGYVNGGLVMLLCLWATGAFHSRNTHS